MKGENDGKKLGFGFMRLPLNDPSDPGNVNADLVKQMVDTYIDAGFNYFDTSWIYHNFKSESFVRDFVVKRYPREKLQISSKLPLKFLKNPTIEQVDELFHKQLDNCGVDHFDTFLLHSINEKTYQTAKEIGAFEYMMDKVKEGVIDRFGCSTHDSPEFLEKMLTEHPEIEFVYLQVNYLDWDNPTIQSKRLCEIAREHGKYVLVMEPVKGGLLSNVPAEAEKLMKDYNPDASIASWAIRYAASVDVVDRVMSGMSTMAQVEDNVRTMREFKPLNDEELEIVYKVADIIRKDTKIACTHCNYCLTRCPKHIPIPDYFALENDFARFEEGHVGGFGGLYNNLAATYGARAGDCVGCKMCEAVCPQNLPISELMRGDVTKHFDGWSATASHSGGKSK
ncbi:MAG: aldo/keto reductase [Lachnospiraceae bacterium]|nr:aldo/keto reductase [Lachnospiraceae bacterium]